MKDFKGQFTQIGKQGGTPEGEGDQQLVVGGWPLSMDHLGGADLPCVAAWHSSPPPPPHRVQRMPCSTNTSARTETCSLDTGGTTAGCFCQ